MKAEIRKKELSAMLALIYSIGYKQPQLFKLKEDSENKEAIEFRKLINLEAKKRNIKPLELIDYFAENRGELLRLLEKKAGVFVKFTKIYEHAEMEKLKSQILKPGKLNKKGRAILKEEYLEGEVEVWRSKDIEYYVKVEDMMKLGGRDPKVFVSQLKNISLILALIQEQQFSNELKEANCEFSLSYYAKRRGYTKEEIQKGGGIFNELKQDLFTGAYTTYRIDKVVINGNEYVAHGIPNFYTLLEPIKDHPGINWIVRLNDPWKGWTTEILNGEATQFFIKDSKAIEDRHTTERPYLFLFYMQLLKRKQEHNLLTKPKKIINLLRDMKLPDKILLRPKECFKVLHEGLIYFSEHYEPNPEIESIIIYNDSKNTKRKKLPLSISGAFKNYSYEEFKGLLQSIGIKDIREAYISIKRPHLKKKRNIYNLTKEEEELRDDILEWTKDWEELNNYPLKKTEEERYKFVSDRIRFLGYQAISDLYKEEKAKARPSAYHFLFCMLADEEEIDWDYY
jgi:hypothetical protein